MVEVTVLGDINVDLLTPPIKAYPKKDSQVLIPNLKMEVGGCAAHSALALAKLEVKTRLIGLIGKDWFGKFLLEKLKEFRVDSKVKQAERGKTGISFGISFKDGKRSLITFRGTNSLLSLKDFKLEALGGKIFLLGGYNLLRSLEKDAGKILKFVKEKGMLTCLEPDLKSGVNCNLRMFKKNLKLVDFFLPDFEEGKILTKEKDEAKIAKKILRFGCKHVVLKLDKKGCLIANKKESFRIRAFKVKAVNPTGAGDFFNAGFIYGLLKYKSLKKAGILGNIAGAFAVTKFGEERCINKEEMEKWSKKVSLEKFIEEA